MGQNDLKSLLDGGYCIGCGACAYGDARISIEMNEFGLLCAESASEEPEEKAEICPFTSSINEDDLARPLYSGISRDSYNRDVGYYLKVCAGHVVQDDYRERASSGGMTSWLIVELMARGEIDGAIHVGQVPGSPRLFEYVISHTEDQVRLNSKSRYYPVAFDKVLEEVASTPQKRYAFVGVPCHIKALRLLGQHKPEIKTSIPYLIGIFCGHQKSAAFAELLGWQQGLAPGSVGEIDFRRKDRTKPANRYSVAVSGQGKSPGATTNDHLYGADWGLGFFKPKACDWCDDVAAETADIAIGDAWLPEYVGDSKGTNILVVRNPRLLDLIEEGIASQHLKLDELSPSKVVDSQAASFRHRREGLAARIELAERRGKWHPSKRVSPEMFEITSDRRKLYALRARLSERSHSAFLASKTRDSFALLVLRMMPIEAKYYWLLRGWRGVYRYALTRTRMLIAFAKANDR
jgi:coenzyme F420-reducing hydrogenase beta subunit